MVAFEHKSTHLTALRQQIRRIERRYAPSSATGYCATGLHAIDTRLGGGLARGTFHEFFDTSGQAAQAARFIAMVLGRQAGPVLWIGTNLSSLYAVGFAQHGLPPSRVTFIEAEESLLPSLCEDALRAAHFTATVIEALHPLHLTASRRLQLAAEQGNGLGILLYHHTPADAAMQPPTASTTRWQIIQDRSAALVMPRAPDQSTRPGPAPSSLFAEAPWCLNLLRHRGGQPHQWVFSPCEILKPPPHDTPHPSRVVSTLAH